MRVERQRLPVGRDRLVTAAERFQRVGPRVVSIGCPWVHGDSEIGTAQRLDGAVELDQRPTAKIVRPDIVDTTCEGSVDVSECRSEITSPCMQIGSFEEGWPERQLRTLAGKPDGHSARVRPPFSAGWKERFSIVGAAAGGRIAVRFRPLSSFETLELDHQAAIAF